MKDNKIKKVLIALDYNSTAQLVAESGYSLAKSMNAEVILLHVIMDYVFYSIGYMNMGPLNLESLTDLNQTSQKFLDNTKEHLNDDTIKTIVKEGDFAESILNTAVELEVDVIVMGSLSQKWLENIVMGSVTEKVLRHTTKPLFIIPTKKES